MTGKTVKIGVTVLVLGAALGGLFYTTLKEGTEYYKHVDEVMANPQQWYGKHLKLHGFAQSVTVRPATLEYRFEIQNNGQVIKAEYRGVVPDTFKDGAEVVVDGKFSAASFQVDPNGVFAKCPSKYDPAAGRGAGGR
jgi:cytochrome c-type biogenesis protein CcmE